jgi:hypothetical protein
VTRVDFSREAVDMANYQVTINLSADDTQTADEIEDVVRVLAEEHGWRLLSMNAVEVA